MGSVTRIIPTGASNRVPGRRRISQADMDQKLDALTKLDLIGIRWAWRESVGQDAPPRLGRDFLARYLAYRLQAQAHGELDRRFRNALDRIANGDSAPLESAIGPGMSLNPGTVLIREYRGETHQVTVLAEGYSWRGKLFPTLSGVARAITRTNWNGYVFFGLRHAAVRERDDG